MDRIFVSIASYRDPQTIPTILDLFEKAKYPENIRIGLCLQQEDDETNLEPIKDLNIDILEYNWRESQGTCWARHIIQQELLGDEEYYLQLDSHHRFCPEWDEILIGMMRQLYHHHSKPIIGGYCPGYFPDKDKDLEDKPMRICSFADFTDGGDLMFVPRTIAKYEQLQHRNIRYIKARFLSGHFIFAQKQFCNDCMYDPNLYFRGEELTLSARAFTHGYDLFHPTKPIVWHEYLREKEIKHWDDHTKKNGFLVTSDTRAQNAKQRARQLLGMEKHNVKFGKYGLGSSRSLHQYELYAGLCFASKQVHTQTYDITDKYIEPHIMNEDEWVEGLMNKVSLEFDLPKNYVTNILNKQANSLALLFYDTKDALTYRKDIKRVDLPRMLNDTWSFQFSCSTIPKRLVLIPFMNNKGESLPHTHIRNIRIK